MTRKKSDILVNILLILISVNMFLILFVSFIPGNDISGFFFKGYGHVCHQGEQGILFGKIVPLPLCYRCLGMHVFFFVGAWIYILYFFRKGKKFSFLFLILFSLPIVIDGLFKFFYLFFSVSHGGKNISQMWIFFKSINY